MTMKIYCLLLVLLVVILWPQHLYQMQAEEKPIYIVIVPEKKDKKDPGIISFCEDSKRQNQFNVILSSIEEHNHAITPKGTRSLIVKYHNQYKDNLHYVVLADGRNKSFLLGKIKVKVPKHYLVSEIEMFSDLFYTDMNNDYVAEFGLSHIKYSFFQKKWEISNQIPNAAILNPFTFITRQWGDGKCARFLDGIDMSQVGYELEQKLLPIIPVKTLYERRGSKTKDGDSKSKRIPTMELNKINADKAILESSVVIGCTTLEKINMDWDKWTLDISIHNTGDTSYFQDSDNDGKVDSQNNEIIIETFLDNQNVILDSYKRFGLFPLDIINDPFANFYSWIQRAGSELHYSRQETVIVDSESKLFDVVLSGLLAGEPVTIAVNNSYSRYQKEINDPTRIPDQELWCYSIIVYGPPEVTLSEFTTKAKIKILPKELDDSSEIIFPLNKEETAFSIKNTGKIALEFTIIFDRNMLNITPAESSIEPGKEQTINLKLKKESIRMNTTPKPKQTTITIKSNAGDKKILVKWKGI